MVPHNLPPLLTATVGRVSELNEISNQLADPEAQVIVLTGLAGSGKTHLALEVAHRQVQETTFSDGVWHIALEDLRDPACLAEIIAGGLKLGFPEQSDSRLQLLQFLETKCMLLLLDNVEQLAGNTSLIAEVLATAPRVRILATSIEPVDLNQVRIVRIGGLRAQSDDESPLADALHLFIQRARRAKPTFHLTSEDLPYARRVCELVNGLPAGIDLATIWVRMLSCSEIVAEMEHSLDFLKTSFRNMHPRHRSLREMFDYSWHRLSAGEQELFRDLAVFEGGCRLDAAVTVLSTDEQRLAALVDRSLLAQTENGRYTQPGLLRKYALEQLAAQDKVSALQQSHALYYLRFLVERTPTPYRNRSQEVLSQLDEERENIRTAWEWAVVQQRLSAIDQSIKGLEYYYVSSGFYAEAADMFERAAMAVHQSTAQGSEEVERIHGNLLTRQGLFLYKQGYLERAEALLHESASLLRSVGAEEDLVDTLYHLGRVISQRGDFARARDYQQESLRLARHIGNRFAEINCLNAVGLTSFKLGEYEQSRKLYSQSLDLARVANDRAVLASTLNDLGYMLSRTGSAAEATLYLNEALNLARKLNNTRLLTYVLATLGEATYAEADFVKSRRYSAESLKRAEKQHDQVLVTHLLIRLGNIAVIEDDIAAAEEFLCRGLHLAMDLALVPRALSALIGLAHVRLQKGNPIGALELLVHPLTHPATEQSEGIHAEELLARLSAMLSEAEIQTARLRGQQRDLVAVVEEILGLKLPQSLTEILRPPEFELTIDHDRQARDVEEITDSEFFKQLHHKTEYLRGES